MRKVELRKYFQIFIIIFMLLFINFNIFVLPIYSQNSNITISVLPFDNVNKFDRLNYLNKSIQDSIHSKLSKIKEINLISNELSTKIADELGYTMDTFQNRNTALRFYNKTGANVCIKGEYIAEASSNVIFVNAFAYCIANEKIIINTSYEFDIETEPSVIENKIANDVRKKLEEQKEGIEGSISNMLTDVEPIDSFSDDYISIDNLISISVDTSKREKYSALISEVESIIANADTFFDAKEYESALENYENALSMIEENELENFVSSDRIKDRIEEINTIIKIINLIKEGDEYAKDGNTDMAEEKYNEAIELINKNGIDDVISTENIYDRINKLSIISKINEIIESGNNLFDKGYYDNSETYYEVALSLIIENRLEDFIPPEEVEEQIRRIKAIREANEQIEKGDEYAEEGNYSDAIKEYEDAIEYIEKNEIEDEIPPEEIQSKIDALSSMTSKFYIEAGGGVGIGNFEPFWDNDIVPSWSLAFNYRLNKFIIIGAGINVVWFELFSKLSFPAFYFGNGYFSEIFIKASVIGGFIPASFEIGGGWTIGYIIQLNESWGIYTDLGGFIMYYFDTASSFYSFASKIGIIFYF